MKVEYLEGERLDEYLAEMRAETSDDVMEWAQSLFHEPHLHVLEDRAGNTSIKRIDDIVSISITKCHVPPKLRLVK